MLTVSLGMTEWLHLLQDEKCFVFFLTKEDFFVFSLVQVCKFQTKHLGLKRPELTSDRTIFFSKIPTLATHLLC